MNDPKKKEIFISKVAIETGDSTIPASLLRDLRRADLFIQLAVLAGSAALGPDQERDPSQTGVFLGTTTGPLDTNFRFLDSLFDNGEGQASPTLFSHSVHNAAAGYVSRLLNLWGPVQTVTTPGWPFLVALAEAKTALELMPFTRALVLAVEEETQVLVEALNRRQGGKEATAPPPNPLRGAVAWLLTTEADSGHRSPKLCDILVEENHGAADFYLQRQDEVLPPGAAAGDREAPASLFPALSLSRALQDGPRQGERSLSWRVTAPCGRARVQIEL
ncbi:MAG: beta-ketoacyl synthase chain length factor [Desulfurivibrio sp.]